MARTEIRVDSLGRRYGYSSRDGRIAAKEAQRRILIAAEVRTRTREEATKRFAREPETIDSKKATFERWSGRTRGPSRFRLEIGVRDERLPGRLYSVSILFVAARTRREAVGKLSRKIASEDRRGVVRVWSH